jgi:hypothetical protein
VSSERGRIRKGWGAKAKPAKRGEQTGPPPLWSENLLAWNVFNSALTQITPGPMGGVLGIRYEGLRVVMWAFGVPDERRLEVFHKVRTLEQIYLKEANRKRKGKRGGDEDSEGSKRKHRRRQPERRAPDEDEDEW